MQNARVLPADLSVLEMHGTGTPLGDPIEIGAALTALGSTAADTPLAFSAVKTVLGHCEPAAGAASMWHMSNRYINSQPILPLNARHAASEPAKSVCALPLGFTDLIAQHPYCLQDSYYSQRLELLF